MNSHKNARLTARGREEILRRLEAGASVRQVAEGACVSIRTVFKWTAHCRKGGVNALQDASSRPHRCRKVLDEKQLQAIAALRYRRKTGDAISQELHVARSTVYRALRTMGLNPFPAWTKALIPHYSIVQRYQWEKPGQMLHLDIKKLGVGVERILTDNGSCYTPHMFKACCAALHIKHKRTRPYTPRTNDQAHSVCLWG